jgi:hypothetical protein
MHPLRAAGFYAIDGSFLSDVLAKIIATVVGGAILNRLALFNGWVKTNKVPLFVGFCGGVVLTAAVGFFFFPNSFSPRTQSTVQAPSPQPSTAPISEPLTPSPPAPKVEPKQISETPFQIYTWYRQFKHPVYGQEMAEKIYYRNYVEWEVVIGYIMLWNNAYIIGLNVPEPPRGSPEIICSFAKSNQDIYKLDSGKKVIIRGIIERIYESRIDLDECQVLKFL